MSRWTSPCRVRRRERARDLQQHAQRRSTGKRTLAAHEGVERLAVDEFHRVEKPLAVVAEVINAGDVAVPQRRGGAGLAHESLPGVRMVEQRRVDDLERDLATQVHVERLVRDSHRAAAQFPRRAVGAPQHFVVLEAAGRFGHVGRIVSRSPWTGPGVTWTEQIPGDSVVRDRAASG